MVATIEQSQRDRLPLENFVAFTPRSFRLRAFFAAALFMLAWCSGRLAACYAGEGQKPQVFASVESRFDVIAREFFNSATQGEIFLEAFEAGNASRLLAVRVVVTASDGSHPDGSGRGVYSDGRFFADGRFSVCIPPGKTAVRLSSGPDYVPLEMTIEAKAGERVGIRVQLARWFAPDQRGWFGGDNHVHAQHDAHALVRTDIGFAALQARADGLSYMTEAGPVELTAAELARLSRPGFLMLHAAELRPACFVGHLNTPGISRPLADRLDRLIQRPLPVQAITEAVRELHGVTIHSHPLAPTHQLHWMGATEIFSDAVLGRCADALDTDSPATELLRFAVLNLGNRLAVSSYTDCDLGRSRTLSPGDRRVYCQAKQLSAAALVQAIRHGRTFATNGGPLFAFFSVDDHLPGDVIHLETEQAFTVRAEIHSRRPLKAVEIYRRGNRIAAFDVQDRQGELILTRPIREGETSWYTLRAEDMEGSWAVSSPIYFEPCHPPPRPAASALLLEISNISRYASLRREFFAHLIATVSPGQQLTEIQLLKDGTPLRHFTPASGNQLVSGKIPVTGENGDYAPGWMWFPKPGASNHFQADYPVTGSGWYALCATTVGGKRLESDAVYFDAANRNSQELSVVNLDGADTQLQLWGYGEEMPLAELQPPTHVGEWWYHHNAFWKLQTRFANEPHELSGGNQTMRSLFRVVP
jgi:hypothetical protein